VKKSRIIIITVILTLVVVSVFAIVIKVKSGASGKPTVVRLEKAQRGELIEFDKRKSFSTDYRAAL